MNKGLDIRAIRIKLLFLVFVIILPTATTNAESIDYKQLYQKSAPAVVLIFGSSGNTTATGTGSIITDNGIILTNAHVATHKGKLWEKLLIVFKPAQVTGKKSDLNNFVKAKLIYADDKRDLALIMPEKEMANLDFLELSDLKKIDIGEPVVAIGHPGGGRFWTMTTGRISAGWTDYNGIQEYDLFQTETAINPGNSGGPLLAGDGSIVGVNTFVVRKNKKMSLEGLNYAIKSTTVAKWISALLVSENSKREITQKPSNKPKTTIQKKEYSGKKESKPERYAKKQEKNVLPAPSGKNNQFIPSPKVKPSKKAYKSDVESGIQFTEDQLLTSFLDDIDSELDGNKSLSPNNDGVQPPVELNKSGNKSGSSAETNGLDNFLKSIN